VRAAAVGLAFALLAGCGGGSSAATSRSGAPTGRASGSAPRAAASSTRPGAPAPGSPSDAGLRLEPVVGGLSAPVAIAAPDDASARIFVVEQAGRIRIVRDGSLVDRPFLDIADRISAGGERGLLGLAFAPAYGTAGENRFFVNYTDRSGNTVIAEYRAAAEDPDVADASSERVLLRVDQPFPNHNGGDLVFAPDGMLYAGLGDGGSGGDPMGNGQRLDTLLGKLLRLDPIGSAGTASPATIAPPDNPFAGRPGAMAAIWSYGLRNPWRFSFDRETGDLWIGDVGQGAWEEVDLARRADGGARGLDYGWNRMEGAHCYPPGSACDQSGLTLPVAEYGHDQGCAIVGGYVDRAPDAASLAGVYLFSDNCSGRIWGLSSGVDGPQDPVALDDSGRAISAFGEAADGGLFVTDLRAGQLLRVVAAAP
jgi:glucose/arabinose dehydrogenase